MPSILQTGKPLFVNAGTTPATTTAPAKFSQTPEQKAQTMAIINKVMGAGTVGAEKVAVGTAENLFSRLITRKQFDYLKARQFIQPNVDGYVNLINPGQKAIMTQQGVTHQVLFKPSIVSKLESTLKPGQLASHSQDAVKGAIHMDDIHSVQPIAQPRILKGLAGGGRYDVKQ